MKNKQSFSAIRLVACDFDGVLTDNTFIIDENGKESVACNRSDGLAIGILRKKGIDVIVISKEKNKVVEARCRKLNIPFIQGVDDKLQILKKEMKKRKLAPEQVCFVGNEINDARCIKYAGLGIAVNDAYPEAKKFAKIITKKKGGQGAIREIAGIILNHSFGKI